MTLIDEDAAIACLLAGGNVWVPSQPAAQQLVNIMLNSHDTQYTHGKPHEPTENSPLSI